MSQQNPKSEPNLRPKKNGWEARATVQGIAYSAYGPTKREAAERLEEKVNGCRVVQDFQTLRSFMETVYLPTIEMQKPKTKEKVIWSMKHLGSLGNLTLAEATRHKIQSHINAKARTHAAGTVRTMAQPWNAALNLAEADGHIPHNPMRHVKLPAVQDSPKDVLDRGELLRLLNASRGYAPHAAVVLASFLGLRIGEIRALRAVHFKTAGQLIVPGTKTAASARIVPLHPRVLAEIAGLPMPLTPRNHSNSNKSIARAAERAGITKHVHNHLLRHTFITLLHWLGCPIDVRARLAGHAKSRVTQGYSHAEWREWVYWTEKVVTFVYDGVGIDLGTGNVTAGEMVPNA
jgi:integrase